MFNRLYEGIKEYIDEGRLLPGEKLPGEREFAEIAGISRGTARRIYTRLREEGYLTVVRGSGTYVRRSEQRRMNFEFLSETGNSGITAMLNSYKLSISSKVLNRGFTDESFFTNRLGLDEGSFAFFLHRVRYGDGEPLVVEYTYLPADEFQGIEEMDFSRVSLYDYMDARDRMPAYFNERFMIIDAPEREGKLLGVNPGDPLYYMEFVCFDRDKQRVEYTESYARCDKFQLNFSNRV